MNNMCNWHIYYKTEDDFKTLGKMTNKTKEQVMQYLLKRIDKKKKRGLIKPLAFKYYDGSDGLGKGFAIEQVNPDDTYSWGYEAIIDGSEGIIH